MCVHFPFHVIPESPNIKLGKLNKSEAIGNAQLAYKYATLEA